VSWYLLTPQNKTTFHSLIDAMPTIVVLA